MKKKTTIVIIAIGLIGISFLPQSDFLSQQKKYERVRQAYIEKGKTLEETLYKYNLDKENLNILLVAFKNEQQLDLYAKRKNETVYKKIDSYHICASSGVLGPKRRQGDGQVPEGFYHIDRFNPSSSFYLSLGINYPNQSDKRKSSSSNLGGDIFIHGECVTIGCLPMTNNKIQEIYIYAIQARSNGQLKIPVYIFPYKMKDENIKSFSLEHKAQTEVITFWKNIKIGHDMFLTSKKELNINVDNTGDYIFK